VTNRARLRQRLSNGVRIKLLSRLPGRVARYGYAALRALDLAAIRRGPSPTVLVTHDLSRSGAPRLMLEAATMLRADGHEVVVVSPRPGPLLDDLAEAGFLVLVDLDLATGEWFEALARRARLVICNTVETSGLVEKAARQAPLLWYLHEVSLLERRLDETGTREALRAATILWAGSTLCADLVRSLRQDVDVVPYGIQPLPQAEPTPSDRLRIGVFGSIEARKGQDLALDALALLPAAKRERIDLRLFGRVLEPDFAKRVMESCDRVGARYGGELDREGYVAAMQQVDAVLVSSRDDTLPLVSIDALGLGKVLLLTSSIGTAAWLKDGVDALVATATDAPALAALLERALSLHGNGGAWPMGAAARAAFAANFSPDAFRARLHAAVARLDAAR
jgi:glycosyltransferase involved in cell wall biosynthesis